MKNQAETSAARDSEIAAAVERWFVETMHNSPVSRDSEIFNHARASVDDLKRRLANLFQEH